MKGAARPLFAASCGCRVASSSTYCLSGPLPNPASKPTTYSGPRFENIAERKLRRRQLTEDGNVEISGRDLH